MYGADPSSLVTASSPDIDSDITDLMWLVVSVRNVFLMGSRGLILSSSSLSPFRGFPWFPRMGASVPSFLGPTRSLAVDL